MRSDGFCLNYIFFDIVTVAGMRSDDLCLNYIFFDIVTVAVK